MPERRRIYISPFTPELLPIVLPALPAISRSTLSFHTVPTFPDRPFGFVTLNQEMADKVRKKLHGTILRGSKMRVEDAGPDGQLAQQDAAAFDSSAQSTEERTVRRSKRKRVREEGVAPGIELPEDRKIRRGWTEPRAADDAASKSKPLRNREAMVNKTKASSKRKTQPSSYTDQEECLFKTKLPPTAPTGSEITPKSKTKKGKGAKGREVTIHEFEHRSKPADPTSSAADEPATQVTHEYDEKDGWRSADGTVVEPAPASTVTASEVVRRRIKRAASEGLEVTTSSAEPASASGENLMTPPPSVTIKQEPPPTATLPPTAKMGPPPITNHEQHPLEALFKKPSLQPPLSAVKKTSPRKPPGLAVKIPFSFFDEPESAGNGVVLPGESSAAPKPSAGLTPHMAAVPMTPFTQRDMHWRRQRSAAPTPDTAAPQKLGFGPLWQLHEPDDSNGVDGHAAGPSSDPAYDAAALPSREVDDLMEEDEDEDEDEEDEERERERQTEEDAERSRERSSQPVDATEARPKVDGGTAIETTNESGKPPSEFSKWFYENRGDNNRAWKRRRREAAKEQRQKENKRRARNAI